jgi:prevent-host-death family protein
MAKQLETVTISELMRNPSAVFRRVQRTGKRVSITRRGAVIVEIAPCSKDSGSSRSQSNVTTIHK